jgi:hypothetical protein
MNFTVIDKLWPDKTETAAPGIEIRARGAGRMAQEAGLTVESERPEFQELLAGTILTGSNE